jgi:hypothetical protein
MAYSNVSFERILERFSILGSVSFCFWKSCRSIRYKKSLRSLLFFCYFRTEKKPEIRAKKQSLHCHSFKWYHIDLENQDNTAIVEQIWLLYLLLVKTLNIKI